jgi:hypothetical protein
MSSCPIFFFVIRLKIKCISFGQLRPQLTFGLQSMGSAQKETLLLLMISNFHLFLTILNRLNLKNAIRWSTMYVCNILFLIILIFTTH